MKTQLISFEAVQNLLSQPEALPGASHRNSVQAAKAVLGSALRKELTPRQQECVRLYYYEGLTEEQAARRLGVGKPTVCRHLQKARKRLARTFSYAEAARQALPSDD